MAGGIEAAGDIATGGLIARAVEPRGGGDGHGRAHGETHGACLNCGTLLVGDYCHVCGQTAHVHRTLGSIGHDLLHGVFHFEGKVWRTIPMLVRRPGTLTRCYIDGKRARFVSPLALFLFAVFVMAASFSWLGKHGNAEVNDPSLAPQQRAEAIRQLDTQITTIEARQRTLAGSAADRHGPIATAGEIERGANDATLAALRNRRDGLTSGHPRPPLEGAATGVGPIDDAIAHVRENPKLLAYKIQSSSYKFSWALIPISTPFVALLFLWRRFPMYDHAIFVTYSLSFMTFLGAALRVPVGDRIAVLHHRAVVCAGPAGSYLCAAARHLWHRPVLGGMANRHAAVFCRYRADAVRRRDIDDGALGGLSARKCADRQVEGSGAGAAPSVAVAGAAP